MRILVATDGSPSAERGVDLIAGLHLPAGTSVRIVDAIETGSGLFGGPWPSLAVRTESIESKLGQIAADCVEQASARLARPDVDVRAEVLHGRPATVIVDAARNWRADVIVIGSRGHGTIESMLLGSVSAEVIDHAPVPVLVARGDAVGRIVLAWDGSACARVAADLLRAWPIFSRSSVHVVSVADLEVPWWTGFPAPGSPETLSLSLDAADASRRTHDALAREMTDELRAAGLEAVAERRNGDAATEIIAAATAAKADVIVLGTHGRTGLARLVLGSVARNVLHHAPCSVLITRAPAGGS